VSRLVDKLVERRKEELAEYDNVIVAGTSLRDFDGKQYKRTVNLQLFINDKGEIVLARKLEH